MTLAGDRARWRPAYVGMGSNLDEPRGQLEKAAQALGRLPDTRLVTLSPFYRSAPMGPAGQPDYVNAVAALLTELSPHGLLAELQRVEQSQGRIRNGVRWGPRTLDLDLLVFGTEEIDDAELTVPHPGIAERSFVLFPWRDIAPHLVIPARGSVSELARRLDADPSTIERIEDRS